MNLNVFSGLPSYVRITILSQIRRLLSTPLFSYEDREDILQDLLLFYLKRFYNVPDVDEALVVHSVKLYASDLLVKRYQRKDFLNSSLADYTDEEFFYFKSDEPNYSDRVMITKILEIASDKEKVVIQKILQGNSIEQIARDMHVSKKTIYKFFEKVRKKLK
jgi:DNA-directed RNA polymerase specialized sigma24 family protein